MVKTAFKQHQEILSFLKEKLEPHPSIHAFWLEGAGGQVDWLNKILEEMETP